MRTKALKKKQAEANKRAYYKKNGVGELATEDAVLFYGYKEPLRKFKGGFGYQGVLSYSKNRDRVQCHICGCLFKVLGKHLEKTHGMTAMEYKDKVGLSHNTALVGEGTRKLLIERARPNLGANQKAIKKSLETRRKLYEEVKSNPELMAKLHPKRTLEHKNKLGLCPDQLLDVIEKTVKSFGRIPTSTEFTKFHNGRFMGSIKLTYGNWGNALKKLKMRPHFVRHTRESLIAAMKNFYKVNKRSPCWSDMERGLLPSRRCYMRKFRTANEARLIAGVPLRIPVGAGPRGGIKWEDWMPSKKERAHLLAQ